jgi:hypothetical protein
MTRAGRATGTLAEQLDRAGGDARLELLADQPMRHRVIVPVDVDVTSINTADHAVRRCEPWGVDAAVERLVLEALTPERLALAIDRSRRA